MCIRDRIKTDVPLELPARALSLRERDVEALRTLYSRYGFNAALRDLDGPPAPAREGRVSVRGTEAGYARAAPVADATLDPALAVAGVYDTVLPRAQLDPWLDQLQAAG